MIVDCRKVIKIDYDCLKLPLVSLLAIYFSHLYLI